MAGTPPADVHAYRNPPMLTEQMREEAARASLSTPQPVYPASAPGDQAPSVRLSGAEQMRAMTAMRHAKLRYPGVVGDVLSGEIAAYKELGYVAQASALVVRLIDELMLPTT